MRKKSNSIIWIIKFAIDISNQLNRILTKIRTCYKSYILRNILLPSIYDTVHVPLFTSGNLVYI